MIGIDTTFLIAAVHQEHSRHREVNDLIDNWLEDGEELALCAHIVAEFLHIVTDGRRFQTPLPIADALRHVEDWMSASSCVWLDTTDEIALLAMKWIEQHRLGRKRVLDTFIAATYAEANISLLATLNPSDFQVFDIFEFLPTPNA